MSPPARSPCPPSVVRAAATAVVVLLVAGGCGREASPGSSAGERATDRAPAPSPDHTLRADQTHNRWSRTIEPILRVEPGAVVEAFTEEASDAQIGPESTVADLADVSFDPIHPLTGPVYVKGARPGDVLAVTLHEVELGEWGWSAVVPGFGFLSEEFTEPFLKTYRFEPGDSTARFADGIRVPLRPFPGVIGVAPDTDSLLSTIPPRRNGGNLDDRDIVEGTTVYLPVLVEGALFSIGDGHAAQGDGEVSGTAIEAPLRIVYEVELLEDPGWTLPSAQYVNGRVYAVTGFAETIDRAARNATRAMVDYLSRQHGLGRTEAYVLASTAADLKIAEAVDVPHMLVTMQIPRRVLPGAAELEAGSDTTATAEPASTSATVTPDRDRDGSDAGGGGTPSPAGDG